MIEGFVQRHPESIFVISWEDRIVTMVDYVEQELRYPTWNADSKDRHEILLHLHTLLKEQDEKTFLELTAKTLPYVKRSYPLYYDQHRLRKELKLKGIDVPN